MNFRITKEIVTAKSRTLSASWTYENILDEAAWNASMCELHTTLNAVKHIPEQYETIKALLGISYTQYKMQNTDVDNTIFNILTDEIQKEIDAEIIQSLKS